MRRLMRILCILSAAALLLGNSNCSKNNSSDAPQFVTSIDIADGSGNVVSSGNSSAPSFAAGVNIEFTVIIRNRSTTTQTVFFNSSEQSNFAVVQSGSADVVWNSDSGVTPDTSAFTSFTLTAGQTHSVTFTWNQQDDASNQVAAGDYEVLGGFTVYNTAGAGSAAANGDSMAEGQPTAAQMFPTVYRSILLPFTIQ